RAGRGELRPAGHDGHMVVRLGVLVGASILALVTACSPPALTDRAGGRTPSTRATTGSSALANAATKLQQISQDSCQIGPAERVSPNCDRYLAELRSAVGTVRNGSADVPGGAGMKETAEAELGAVETFDRDGCGTSRPGAAGPSDSRVCVA